MAVCSSLEKLIIVQTTALGETSYLALILSIGPDITGLTSY